MNRMQRNTEDVNYCGYKYGFLVQLFYISSQEVTGCMFTKEFLFKLNRQQV